MRKFKFWHFTLILSIITIILFVFYVYTNNNIYFQLKGSNNYSIKLDSNYIELGFIAKVFNTDLSTKVESFGGVNTSKVGTYFINYKLKFLGKVYNLQRCINVVDNDKPSIKLNGEEEVTIYVNDDYEEKGATALDNYDGDITDNIVISGQVNNEVAGEYILKYIVTDSSKNTNSVSRKIVVKEKEVVKKSIYDVSSIDEYILSNNYNVSIGYYNLVTGNTYYYNENKIYYGASLIKTLDAIYLYDKDLVTDELKPYINRAISVSDNDAHHYLVDYIGKENLRNYGLLLGANYTLEGRDYYGITNVLDQMVYLKKLYSIILDNDELKSFFINDYVNFIKINGLTNVHKYGYYNIYFHDVGIIFDEEDYIIVILTEHGQDKAYKVIENLSNLMFRYHKGEIT